MFVQRWFCLRKNWREFKIISPSKYIDLLYFLSPKFGKAKKIPWISLRFPVSADMGPCSTLSHRQLPYLDPFAETYLWAGERAIELAKMAKVQKVRRTGKQCTGRTIIQAGKPSHQEACRYMEAIQAAHKMPNVWRQSFCFQDFFTSKEAFLFFQEIILAFWSLLKGKRDLVSFQTVLSKHFNVSWVFPTNSRILKGNYILSLSLSLSPPNSSVSLTSTQIHQFRYICAKKKVPSFLSILLPSVQQVLQLVGPFHVMLRSD